MPPQAQGRGTGYQPPSSLIDRLIAAGIYAPPGAMVPEYPKPSNPGSLFPAGRFDAGGRMQLPDSDGDYEVQGEGMPLDREEDMALSGLREASGNLAPMLNRYGLGGSGNIDRSGGKTRVSIHGDPVQAEASRVRALRDDARRAGDLNRMLAQSRAQMIAGGNDYPRMDPNDAARFERDSVLAADAASPEGPEPTTLPRGVDELAALRGILDRARVGRQVTRENTVDAARTVMDPTVTAGRETLRREGDVTAERDILGRIRTALAGNSEAAFMPELQRLLGLTPAGGDTGAGATDTMTQDELLQFARESGMQPEDALQYVMRHGITVQ